MRGWLAKSLQTLALVALAATTDWAHAHTKAPSEAELGSFVPRPELVRSASLGFRSLVADYYWLRAVQVVGATDFVPSRSATHIGKLLDIVTDLDPWVDHPYRFGAVWMTESEENVRHANQLLRRGIAYHPEDWRNRFYLGFNQFYYLEENEAAADTLEPAAQMKGAPPYLSSLAVRLRSQSGALESAEIFLAELARRESDPYKRAEYEEALREVETERRARFLDRARAEYQRRNARDIASVEDLLGGKSPVLREIPAEPNGKGWRLSEAGEIVSTFYGSRYVVHRNPVDEERRLKWHAERPAEASAR